MEGSCENIGEWRDHVRILGSGGIMCEYWEVEDGVRILGSGGIV